MRFALSVILLAWLIATCPACKRVEYAPCPEGTRADWVRDTNVKSQVFCAHEGRNEDELRISCEAVCVSPDGVVRERGRR